MSIAEQGNGKGVEFDGMGMWHCVGLQQVDRMMEDGMGQGGGAMERVFLQGKHYFLRKTLA